MRIPDKFFVIGGLDPGDVMAVAGAVVEAQDRAEIFTEPGDIGKGLVASCRVLNQDHLQTVALKIKGFQPSERSAGGGEGVDCLPGREL